MRRYSDKTALKKIHEILDPILEKLREYNPKVYFSYWWVCSMYESYNYIEVAWAKVKNNHVFWQRILKWWKWHDVYEKVLETKDSIYDELLEFLHWLEEN